MNEDAWDTGEDWTVGISRKMGEAFYADVKRYEQEIKRCHEILDAADVPRRTPEGRGLELADRVAYVTLRK